MLAQQFDRRADFWSEQCRLFPRREVAALVGILEVEQVAMGALGLRLRLVEIGSQVRSC
jgi:hypothetical protein